MNVNHRVLGLNLYRQNMQDFTAIVLVKEKHRLSMVSKTDKIAERVHQEYFPVLIHYKPELEGNPIYQGKTCIQKCHTSSQCQRKMVT